MSQKKIYFASDQHFGAPNFESSRIREKAFVDWLDSIKVDAEQLFLLGDLFDFWIEYKNVVPRGFTRVLGKLAELSDSGIKIHFFTGNHDLWMRDYFELELGISVYRDLREFNLQSKRVLIGHGDGLGPGDISYKLMKKVFKSPISIWLFSRLHPNFAIGIANYFSRKSRIANGNSDEVFLGEDKEQLLRYIRSRQSIEHFDFYVFGHRHLAMELMIGPNSKYINTGEWVKGRYYAVMQDGNIELKSFKN